MTRHPVLYAIVLLALAACANAHGNRASQPSSDVVLCEGSYQLRRVAVLGPTYGSVEFYPNQNRISFVAQNGPTTLRDASTGELVKELYSTRPTSPELVDYSNDQELMVWRDGEGGLDLIRTRSGEVVASLQGEIFFSSDGSMAAYMTDDSVGVVDTGTGREIGRRRVSDDVRELAFSSDGKRLIGTSFYGNPDLVVLDSAWRPHQFADGYDQVEFDDEGRRALESGDAGWRLIEVDSGKVLAQSAAKGEDARFRGGRFVYVQTSTGGYVVNTQGVHMPVGRIAGSSVLKSFGLQFSSDGTRVVARRTDGFAALWDLQSGSKLAELGPFEPKSIADSYFEGGGSYHGTSDTSGEFFFLPDHDRLVTADKNGELRVWNSRTGELVRLIGTLDGSDRYYMLARGQNLSVWMRYDGHARLLNLETGKPVADLGSEFRVGSFIVELSPDRRTLLVGGRNEFAVWDTMTGRRIWNRREKTEDFGPSFLTDDSIAVWRGSLEQHAYELLNARTGQHVADMGPGEPTAHQVGSRDLVLGGYGLWDSQHGRRLMDCSKAALTQKDLPFKIADIHSVGDGLSIVSRDELWRIEPRR